MIVEFAAVMRIDNYLLSRHPFDKTKYGFVRIVAEYFAVENAPYKGLGDSATLEGVRFAIDYNKGAHL